MMPEPCEIARQLQNLTGTSFAALDFLPGANLAEKVTALMLERTIAHQNPELAATYNSFQDLVTSIDVSNLKVVALGGGTGLSNIIGGDSKQHSWKETPFTGMKEVFAKLHSVVCVTDDGGSTGELLKDLPLIALGDLRHVLLSAVRNDALIKRYQLDDRTALKVAQALHAIFNYRFISRPHSSTELLTDTGADLGILPVALRNFFYDLSKQLFNDERLAPTLYRPQCLGNLLLAAAIYKQLDPQLTAGDLIASHQVVRTATIRGLAQIEHFIGTRKNSVFPCTTTSSQLQILYDNGVLVTSEYKSGHAQRGYPVDRVLMEFSRNPYFQPEVEQLIASADIIVFAPGSLYTSIIPILQVPGLADAIRHNHSALKLLVANIWVQKGETDTARDSPDRKFYVSDLIRAYHRNIPGGVKGLFTSVLGLNMREVPGSTLQRYALEDKEPIYFDRHRVEALGFRTVAARIYSDTQLQNRGVIQHDPAALAGAIKTLWALKTSEFLDGAPVSSALPTADFFCPGKYPVKQIPCHRYEKIQALMHFLSTETLTSHSALPQKMEEAQRRRLLDRLVELTWLHPDILFDHLKYFRGITLIAEDCWKRSQQWDNVFSFYDPVDRKIKIRQDQTENLNSFEVVFLIALGQSLLGNYAQTKEMVTVSHDSHTVGKMYKLQLRERDQLKSYLSFEQISTYLEFCKMQPAQHSESIFTRMLNFDEGFTPPGLFFGLFYAWYLDNRFAPHIEYKMSIMKNDISDLIPEQIRTHFCRETTITFFREQVFRHTLPFSTHQQKKGKL